MDTQHPKEHVGPLVDRLFRRESGRMMAWLLKWLGPGHAELAEDAVQEALLAALKAWPYRGTPDDPTGWLWRVARNAAIDRIRKTDREASTARLPEIPDNTAPAGSEDAELSLLFICTDLGLSPDTSIPLTLKLACGFGDTEISGALSIDVRTVRQRIVRAKRRWRETQPLMDLAPADMDQRCSSVMNVIYLILNEGYGSHHPDHWQRAELCREAVRLSQLLARHRNIDRRDADALAALCLFQTARTPGRTSETGGILLLDEQDRSLWDKNLISQGFQWLRHSGRGQSISAYHLLAGIAACHVAAATITETDWTQILKHYDHLIQIAPASPFHRLNRAIALVENGCNEAAGIELKTLENHPTLSNTYLLPATRAWALSKAGQLPEARRNLIVAIDKAPSEQIRHRLMARLETF